MEKKENVSGRIRAKAGVQNGIVSEDEFQRVANKVSFVTIIGNILLSVMKLIAGFIAHSNAMISDAIHSASDVFSTFVVIIGIKLASKKADKEHPYGHERLECVAAIVLSMVLFITSFSLYHHEPILLLYVPCLMYMNHLLISLNPHIFYFQIYASEAYLFLIHPHAS